MAADNLHMHLWNVHGEVVKNVLHVEGQKGQPGMHVGASNISFAILLRTIYPPWTNLTTCCACIHVEGIMRCSIVSHTERADAETGSEAFQAVAYVAVIVGVCCLAALMLVVAGVLLYRVFRLQKKSKIPH